MNVHPERQSFALRRWMSFIELSDSYSMGYIENDRETGT
jgi:hypothetical protein